MNWRCRIFNFWFQLNPKTNEIAKAVRSCLLVHSNWYSKLELDSISKRLAGSTLNTMKLDSPQFKACLSSEVIMLRDVLISLGHETRIVGGAVRDLLLGVQPVDLDLSTTATPEEMRKIFTENNIRLINRNGEKHGTITTRVNDKNFEITTLRIDMLTDGRHAEVQFTKDWQLDASRRDLTINAMYLGFDGTLYDYFNGYEDLKNHRVVFVGNAAERIQEDYLRILRYFRFYGKVAKGPDNHDEDVLKAIADNVKGLEIISGERVFGELNKIMSGRFSGDLLEKIVSLNIGPYIGFPENCNVTELKALNNRLKLKDLTVKPMTFLTSLFNTENELQNFFARIKPSCAEQELANFIFSNRGNATLPLREYQSLLIKMKNRKAGYHTVFELLKYEGKTDYLEELKKWVPPPFPVNGHMLKDKGIHGKKVGSLLNDLKDIWIGNGFNLTAEELLKHVPDDLQNSPTFPEKKRKV